MAHEGQGEAAQAPGPDSEGDERSTLAKENASLRDRLLRSLADSENDRRRSERGIADARQYAIATFAGELLTVIDNLERALASAADKPQQAPGDAALLDGVRATQRLLLATLERFGVRRIDALGAPFDPTMHEAVTEIDEASLSPRSVVRVLEEGYTIHERLLRPARVVITRARPEPKSPVEPTPLQSSV